MTTTEKTREITPHMKTLGIKTDAVKGLEEVPQGAVLLIYTDGACIGNPGDAGCAFIALSHWRITFGKARHLGHGTNNIAEMTAVIDALEAIRHRPDLNPIIRSDSQLVIKGMNEWMAGWLRKDWRTASGPVKNRDLWERINELAAQFASIKWQWVRGHNGEPFNEIADQMAEEAAADNFIDPDA